MSFLDELRAQSIERRRRMLRTALAITSVLLLAAWAAILTERLRTPPQASPPTTSQLQEIGKHIEVLRGLFK